MNSLLHRSLRTGPVMMALVALLLVVLTNHAVQLLIEDNRWVIHTLQARDDADDIRQFLLEESSARTSWRTTGEEEHRLVMEQAGKAAIAKLNSVRSLTRDNPAQQARLRQLEPLVRRRLEISALRDGQQRQFGVATPGGRELLLEGVRLTSQIRGIVNAIVSEENYLLAARSAASERSALLTVGVVAVVSVLCIVGLLGTAGMMRRELRVRAAAETSLRSGEQRFRSLLEAAPDAMVIVDEAGCIVLVNAQTEKMFGWPRESLVGQKVEVLVPERLQAMHVMLRTGYTANACTRPMGTRNVFNARRQDGTEFPAEISLSPLQSEDGLLITAAIRDVTKRVSMEIALAASEALHHSLVDNLPLAVFRKDREGRFVFGNSRFCTALGRSWDQIAGRMDTDFFPAELAEKYRRDDARVLETGSAMELNEEGKRPDGTTCYVHVIKNPVRDKSGEVVGVQGIFEDVTARFQAESALRESERRFRQLVHTLPAAVYACDATGRVTLYNQAAATLWGREPDPEQDKWCGSWKVFNPDGSPLPLDECPMAVTMQTGKAVVGREVVVERPDGSRSRVLPHPVVTRDTAGTITGGVNMLVDLTERVRAEERLAAERRLLRTVIDNLPGYIFAKDTDGRYTVSNRAQVRLLGAQSEAEVLGRTVFDFFPADMAGRFADDDASLLRTGEPVLNREESGNKDGARVWHQLSKIPLRDDQGRITGLVGLKQDITAQKLAEESVRQAEAKYREIFDNAVEGIVQTDPSGRIITANPTMARLLGYGSPTELLAAGLNMNRDVHARPDDRTTLLSRTGVSERDFIECQFKRRDGELIWVSFNIRVVRDERGEPRYFEGTCVDTTESRRLEEQLRQAQKMEAVGQLAGGIAHDFNNIIGAILGNVELVRLLPVDHPGREESLDAIHSASKRAADLVKQILAFSRRQEQRRQPMELRIIVREVLKLLRATIPAHVEFGADLATTPTVLADPSEIHQVAMNLCTNAWHALNGEPGSIHVALDTIDVSAAQARRHPDLRPGPYVRFSITDTGCGMDAATLARIFDPFFTTKPAGQGTGLGLAVVHGIMKSHDGGIIVESQPGAGTTFHLYFPVFAAGVVEAASAPSPLPRGSGEHILFVDDEEPMARMGQAALERMGYQVTTTTSPSEALEWFRNQPENFSLVITDFNMPGLDGAALARQLHEVRAEVRVMLATGYSATMDADAARKAGFCELLPKPYGLRNLGEAVKRVLASTKGDDEN